MAGNIMGGRSYYGYTADSGVSYSILMDDSLAVATGCVLNDTFPAPPRRFKPRGVFVEKIVGSRVKRKFLICPLASSDLYKLGVTQQFTIDTVVFDSTGRRGETLSFARNSDASDPGDEDGVPPT